MHGPRCRLAARLLALLALGAAAAASAGDGVADAERMIVVALRDRPDPVVSAGSTPRGYGGLADYAGGTQAKAAAAAIARDYGLSERAAWTIEPLRLRCMLFEIPPGADRAALLTRIGADERVRLAQPQHVFTTLGADAPHGAAPAYDDPYVGLQRGFAAIGAAAAQRWSDGRGVRVALVDAGVDAGHPDLAGRVAEQRDFVDGGAAPARERHGTEIAGVIAAVAHNGLGIVGVAPGAQLLAYRACRAVQPGADSALCDTFTLAQALAAAIASGARVINLSLGGPADPLLEELTRHAIGRGAIVVGAVPPDGRGDGFPVGVPGVIAVASAGAAAPAGALAAPGSDILTLEPEAHYDYASGSSLAAAHVSGAIALLLAIDPRLDAAALRALLGRTRDDGGPIDVCAAAAALRARDERCAKEGS
jgi:hypothetical protein